MAAYMKYTGKVQPDADQRRQDPDACPYLPDEALVEAVNLAIFLERPLFLRGEPGCGKTRLARAIAHELQLPLECWHVKSTSRAQDGLYTYDAVRRLHDVQLSHARPDDEELRKRIDDPLHYIDWGPLGKAFRNPQRTVVLIDEIDKADIDFPNDLLLELDEKRFTVKELGNQEFRAQEAPIVCITSNDEKDLPDAFLRRCVFHYIQFPDKAQLLRIVQAHYPESVEALGAEIIDRIVACFLELRQKMEEDKQQSGKRVSSGELLDWYRVLWKFDPESDIKDKLAQRLRYPGVLVKSWEDYQRYGLT